MVEGSTWLNCVTLPKSNSLSKFTLHWVFKIHLLHWVLNAPKCKLVIVDSHQLDSTSTSAGMGMDMETEFVVATM